MPCTVRSVTTTSIVCETASVPALAPYPPPPPSPPPPNASLPAVAAAPVEEPAAVLYAGGRGVRRETHFFDWRWPSELQQRSVEEQRAAYMEYFERERC